MTAPAGPAQAVIRISPMAHFAPAFLALAMLTLMPALGSWALALLAIPLAISVAIVRLRTTADGDAVTARGLLASRTLPWTEVEGLLSALSVEDAEALIRELEAARHRARPTDGGSRAIPPKEHPARP